MDNKKDVQKLIKKEVKSQINEGKSKQEIFDNLKNSYNQFELAKIIRNSPTIEMMKKYKKKNGLLIVLLSITLFFDLLGLTYGAILWDLALLYLVISFKAGSYHWITFRAIASIFILSIFLFASEFSLLSIISTSVSLLILIPTLIIASKLTKILCPIYEQKKIRITDENGKQKIQIQFIFKN